MNIIRHLGHVLIKTYISRQHFNRTIMKNKTMPKQCHDIGMPIPNSAPNAEFETMPKNVKKFIGLWQGVAMDSLKFHLGLLCPTLLHPAGGPPLKRPYSRFGGSRVLPLWTQDIPCRTPVHLSLERTAMWRLAWKHGRE
jgi:hypothetical protein